MKTIKVNEIELNIPENWGDVKLKDYVTLTTVLHKGLSEGKGNMGIVIDLINALFKIEKSDIYKISVEVFNEIITCFLFVNEPVKSDIKNDFIELNGKKYKFKTEFDKLSVGEMISYEILVQNSENLYKEFDKILSVLLREVNEDGYLKDFDADLVPIYLELLQDISILDVYGLTLFFSNGVNNFMKGSAQSSL